MNLLLLLKVTLLFALALAILPLLKRASASLRHLVCAAALGGSLLLPLAVRLPDAGVPFPYFVVHASSAAAAGSLATAASRTLPLVQVFAAISVLLLLRVAFGLWAAARLVRSSSPFRTSLTAVPVRLANVSVPIAAGIVRPVILLPLEAIGWNPELLEAALRHESAHVARRDLWTNLIAHLACAVYWFHPLAWMVARQLRREQELACDDAVLDRGFDAGSYADALIAAARSATATNFITGCPMFTTGTLQTRITHLFDRARARPASCAALLRAGIFSAAVLTALALLTPLFGFDEPHKIGNGVSAPAVIYKEDPQYSDAARQAKISGTVLLKVVVSADGTARDISVVRGLDPELDSNAIKSIQNWRFRPGMLNGQPVDVQAQIEVNFRLLDKPPAQ